MMMTEVEEKKELTEEEKKKAEAAKKKKEKKEDHDEPLWQEVLTASLKVGILGWSVLILTLSYCSLPEKLTFGTTGIEIPEQGNIDPSFPASLLGGILSSLGIATATAKKNGNGNGGGLTEEKLMKILATMNNNEQVIRVQTPIHIVGGELLKSEKTTKDS